MLDGTDYGPIRQASAIEHLRQEVKELKEQLRDARTGHTSSGEYDHSGGPYTKLCSNAKYLGRRCNTKKKPAVLRVRDESVRGFPDWLVSLEM